MTGKVLANRYRIGARIGGGGMALVYRAEDLQLGRDVAVKVLRGQFGQDEEFIRRFRREAQNAASLSHPNVVQIFDVGQEEDQYFIVMELIEGPTLKALIQEQGPLPVAEAGRIAGEILSALAHAHNHRIVHRDIKPHNILITRDGRVKVTDFGIARATTTDTVTHTGSIMGSAHYFSPEQANGQPTGEKSDIYSVGIVLYEMVTGVVPFQGESPISVALKHLRDNPSPPSQLNSEVPVELEEIILRALEKEPEDRYLSAETMREALTGFLAAHAAGKTHIRSGDFPTMDLRGMPSRKTRRSQEDQRRQTMPEDDEELDEEEEERPRGRRRKSRAWIWVTLVALLVFGALGAGGWALVNMLEVPEVDIPPIKGLHLTEAQKELAKVKLRWEVQGEQFSDDVPQFHVIKSDPLPGTAVKEGRSIALTISKGPDTKPLPDVRGRNVDDARAVLETERFKVGEITPKYSQQPEGQVIEMVPQPLTLLRAGSTVNLVVSQGPLRVPQVIDKPLHEAREMLIAAGLNPKVTEQLPNTTRPKDTVLSTDPRVGDPVVPGQTVNLVVSAGGTGEAKSFSKVITVPGLATQFYDVRITLVDVVNGVPGEQPPLIQEKRRGGEKITVTGTFYGEAYLRIFIDNREQPRVELP